jgi:hypothetical protein
LLFTAMIVLVLGYTMIYSALHGRWEFWTYFFPAGGASTSQPVA